MQEKRTHRLPLQYGAPAGAVYMTRSDVVAVSQHYRWTKIIANSISFVIHGQNITNRGMKCELPEVRGAAILFRLALN